MDKHDLAVREAATWEELEGAIGAIAPGRREVLAITADGWTVKDVLWHVAHWWGHLTELLHTMREGTYEEPSEDDEATDVENAQVLAESKRMGLDEVTAGVQEARRAMLAAWTVLPEVTEAAERWFVWETIEHYEEHLADVRAAGDAG
jgi:hypothetical protein